MATQPFVLSEIDGIALQPVSLNQLNLRAAFRLSAVIPAAARAARPLPAFSAAGRRARLIGTVLAQQIAEPAEFQLDIESGERV
jgi:hypothetical protein